MGEFQRDTPYRILWFFHARLASVYLAVLSTLRLHLHYVHLGFSVVSRHAPPHLVPGKKQVTGRPLLGFITYASAFSAPLGGALADRVGKKPILLASSAAILGFSFVYAQACQLWLILLTAVVHGVFWSALLASSAAMMIGTIPDARRAEGPGYWGLASTLAIATAPAAGLWLLQRGWGWLCFCMGSLAGGELSQ